MKKFVFEDFELAYRDYGNPSNPAIILMHGNSAGSAIFEAQFIELLNNYYLVAPDFIGHDNSGKSEALYNYSMQGMAKSIIALIDALELKEVVLYGVSLGGHVAMEMTAFSGKIKGIMISGSPPVPQPFEMDDYFVVSEALLSGFQAEASESIANRWGAACVHQNVEAENLLAQLFKKTDPTFRVNFGQTVNEQIGLSDEKNIIESLEMPVAILEGRHEMHINNEYLRELKINDLYNNKVISIENSCHYLNMENPEVFNEVLRRFAECCFESS